MSAHFKWLAVESVKKNFDVRETIILVFPTTFAYFEILSKIKFLSLTLVISTSILVLLVLFIFQIDKNFQKNKKAVAEVLETGYFNNFFRPFATELTNKLKMGQKLVFDFKNKAIPSTETSDVEVKIILPESKDKLDNVITAIDAITHDACIDNSFWVKVKVADNNKVIIYECPRTLTAIEHHLINGETEYTNEESIKFHRYFSEKFMKDYSLTRLKFTVSNAV